MKSLKKYLLISFLFPCASMAANVAVTDSGTDFSHEWLQGRALVNTADASVNRIDDDRNGKVDDVVGWNFVDGYSRVFFPEHLAYVEPITFKYFDVISRLQMGRQTPEDEKFWQDNFKNLPKDKKAAVVAQLNFYGQYAHSTHVSGIIAQLSPNSKIMSARVFPDTPPDNMKGAVGDRISTIAYKLLAALTNGTFDQVGTYLAERKIDVANYSLGVSLQSLAKMILALKGVANPTPEQLMAETKKALEQYIPFGQKWMGSSPGTLFVVAAGNDGSNNDQLPVFPASVKVENSITVAATDGFTKLASFSNYGESVDVAAPGAAIVSSVPSLDHKQTLAMSGTSMAAPYVTGVAAKVKDLNPVLTPAEIRTLLMGTVDYKDWLKGKVASGGVVNFNRAYMAAQASTKMLLKDAIALARAQVVDQTSQNEKTAEGFIDSDLSLFVF